MNPPVDSSASAAQQRKMRAAQRAITYIQSGSILGVGTGSTVNALIDLLGTEAPRIGLRGAVSSSEASSARLRECGIPVLDLNEVGELPLYIDGADESTRSRQLTKGGGAALTREKIVAAAARRFICILDDSKLVDLLGRYPVPVEVIPMARNYVARCIGRLGGRAVWREGVISDNGNQILDVHGWSISDPCALEDEVDRIVGVVTVGLFARRPADLLIVGTERGVTEI